MTFRQNQVGMIDGEMNDIEKKIELVNASMIDARNETEKFEQIKKDLEGNIGSLEEEKKIMEENNEK